MDNSEENSNSPSVNILLKVSSQLNWLVFSVLIIIGTSFFLLYDHHFGSLKWSYEREMANKAKIESGHDIGINIEDIGKTIEKTKEANSKLGIITLPILGIPLIKRDFVILYLIIGVIFLFWIFTLIKYIKNFLENVINDFYFPSDANANILMSAFFLMMPTDYSSKRYKYFEWLFMLFSLTIILLILSDVYEIFFSYPLYNLPLYRNPSFSVMAPHLIVAYTLIFACLGVSVYLFHKSKRTLNHIRNLLLLLRWNRVAFFPTLYSLAKKNGKVLREARNFLEYRKCDDSGRTKLLMILNFEGEENYKTLSAEVDLSKSSRLYFKNHEKESYLPETDEKVGRILTPEESFMRHYFEAILTDDIYEKDLYQVSPFKKAFTKYS